MSCLVTKMSLFTFRPVTQPFKRIHSKCLQTIEHIKTKKDVWTTLDVKAIYKEQEGICNVLDLNITLYVVL